MISLSTTALVAGPAARLVSRMASGIADVGRDFVSVLDDSPEEADVALNDVSATGEDAGRVAASNSSLSTVAKPSAPNKPTTLADLLQAIQNLIANLSDDSEETVTIESLSGDEVQVTGDEPLATSIKQWTKLHPEWARDWNTQAATTSASSKDLAPKKLSARISSTSVTLEPT
ncbi:MAG: hypothetical protein NTW52_06480 [Planctomycetota bacterium]|nr:hypothetical protein [Planctomycetota bacterium]